MAHLLQSEFRPEPNEVVLFQARHSFKTVLLFLSPFLWLPLAGSMVAVFGPDVLEVNGYAFVSLAVLYLFWRATSHLYASVTITDRRVVARSGITNQDPVEIFHREIDLQSLEEVGRSAGAEIRDLFGNELPLKHIGNAFEICRRLADIRSIDSSHIPSDRVVSLVRRTVLMQTGFCCVVILAWVLMLRLILDDPETNQLAMAVVFTFAFVPAGLWLASISGSLASAASMPRDLDGGELRQIATMLLGAGTWNLETVRKRWGFNLFKRILSHRFGCRIEL
jgi:hypothetical protein